MDEYDDPSDRGLSPIAADYDPRRRTPRRTSTPAAPQRPASAAHRRAVIDGVCMGQGWRPSRRDQLAYPCSCGAGSTSWCRRAGTPVVGHIHHRRGKGDDTRHAE